MSEYRESPNYVKATAQERNWFDIFIASNNELTATLAAYKVNGDDSARAMGRKVANRDHIAALIAEFCTVDQPLPTLDELKREYIGIARNANSTPREQLMALNSYERLCGWGKSAKPAEPDGAGYDPALDDIRE